MDCQCNGLSGSDQDLCTRVQAPLLQGVSMDLPEAEKYEACDGPLPRKGVLANQGKASHFETFGLYS
jgi:hypothetical protein